MITIQHIFFFAILIIVSIYHHSFDADAFIFNDPMTAAVQVQLKIPVVSYAGGGYRLASSSSSVQLRMGILDSILSKFQNDDDGDNSFVKLEDMIGSGDLGYGPGPAVLLHNIPNTITDEEVLDMLSDSAPMASQKGISMARIISSTTVTSKSQEHLLSLSLKDALEKVVHDSSSSSASSKSHHKSNEPLPLTTTTNIVSTTNTGEQQQQHDQQVQEQDQDQYGECTTVVPVVIFSGLSHTEMMASYNVLGEEIYKETAQHTPTSTSVGMHLACATAVPNAMKKPLSQVIFEISGDHLEAIQGQECLL